MTQKQERSWIKANKKELNEFFQKRISVLLKLMLEAPREERDKYADSVNVLRDWLRESAIIGKEELPKQENFI